MMTKYKKGSGNFKVLDKSDGRIYDSLSLYASEKIISYNSAYQQLKRGQNLTRIELETDDDVLMPHGKMTWGEYRIRLEEKDRELFRKMILNSEQKRFSRYELESDMVLYGMAPGRLNILIEETGIIKKNGNRGYILINT